MENKMSNTTTTGEQEWTETRVAEMWRQELSIDANIRILLDQFNAALDAARKEGMMDAVGKSGFIESEVRRRLTETLAAERELREKAERTDLSLLQDDYKNLLEDVKRLRKQLDDEQVLSRGIMQQIERHQQELIGLHAALAAVAPRLRQNLYDVCKERDQLREQLDAEREKCNDFITSNGALTSEVQQLIEQLAAERERFGKILDENEELREKVQTLMDALEVISYGRGDDGNELQCIADAALAKIGGKP